MVVVGEWSVRLRFSFFFVLVLLMTNGTTQYRPEGGGERRGGRGKIERGGAINAVDFQAVL